MVTVHFTARLRALVPAGRAEIDSESVGDALEQIFARNGQMRGYVLDEQGKLRKHVCIFLDGERLPHETALVSPVGRSSEIYVMQALSGG
jgi:sulfur-carrier protein